MSQAPANATSRASPSLAQNRRAAQRGDLRRDARAIARSDGRGLNGSIGTPWEERLLRELELTINGETRRLAIEDTTSLLEALRNPLGLKAARFGCGAGQCGACAVTHRRRGRGRPASSRSATSTGKAITTLEGLGTAERPHPLQTAFLELQAGQCGYCLSGILVGAKALLDAQSRPQPRRDRRGARLAPLPLRRAQPDHGRGRAGRRARMRERAAA